MNVLEIRDKYKGDTLRIPAVDMSYTYERNGHITYILTTDIDNIINVILDRYKEDIREQREVYINNIDNINNKIDVINRIQYNR